MIIDVSQPPEMIGDKRTRLAAHQSDAWRLELLLNQGGIYMDWDVIVTNSFDPLLNTGVIFGIEKKVPDYFELMGVAVLLSRSHEPFMELWKKEMAKEFDGEKCYACHSTVLARKLAVNSDKVTVLNHFAFYHPGWEQSAYDSLFQPLPHKKGSKLNKKIHEEYLKGTYAIHLFESHANFQPILPTITGVFYYDCAIL